TPARSSQRWPRDRASPTGRAGVCRRRPSRGNANMNGGASSSEPSVRGALYSAKMGSQELRPPDLHVRWLGRMEFARALALQEEIVFKKRDDCSVEDQLALLA